jgi:hypothetical protein
VTKDVRRNTVVWVIFVTAKNNIVAKKGVLVNTVSG